MLNRTQKWTHGSLHTQFFRKFSTETVRIILAGFQFAPGKFPKPSEVVGFFALVFWHDKVRRREDRAGRGALRGDALRGGLPVLTLPGRSFPSRVAASRRCSSACSAAKNCCSQIVWKQSYMHLSIMHTGRNACISVPQLYFLY